MRTLVGKWKNETTFVDNDPSLNYETGGVFYSTISRIIGWLLSVLPKKSLRKAIATSERADKVRNKATSHEALELMYEGPKNEGGIISNIGSRFWFRIRNTRAVRNRLKLVKKIIGTCFTNMEKDKIYVASLGAGSARAVLEEVKKQESLRKFEVYLVDLNPTALECGRNLSISLGIKSHINYVNEKVGTGLSIFNNLNFDVVEMVGLLDYFDDIKASAVIKKIKQHLNSKGFLITCNIVDNAEQKFITNVVDWKMYYRYPDDMIRLMKGAGFNEPIVVNEPLLIHAIAIGENA